MGVTDDHVHEVQVVVHGAQVVHRHYLTFIGVPGDVTVLHRSQPVPVATWVPGEDPLPPQPSDWEEHEPSGEWYEQDEPWDDTPVRHDA